MIATRKSKTRRTGKSKGPFRHGMPDRRTYTSSNTHTHKHTDTHTHIHGCGLFQIEPYVMLRTNNDSAGHGIYEGYIVDLMTKIAEIVGFRYRLIPAWDGRFGYMDPDGHWDGMIGELERRVMVFTALLMHVYQDSKGSLDTHRYTCMHACMHTYMHTYIYTYIHTHIHTYIHTYTHTYIHTYIHTCTYIHTYIHTYICTCISHHAYNNTHAGIHIHFRKYIK